MSKIAKIADVSETQERSPNGENVKQLVKQTDVMTTVKTESYTVPLEPHVVKGVVERLLKSAKGTPVIECSDEILESLTESHSKSNGKEVSCDNTAEPQKKLEGKGFGDKDNLADSEERDKHIVCWTSSFSSCWSDPVVDSATVSPHQVTERTLAPLKSWPIMYSPASCERLTNPCTVQGSVGLGSQFKVTSPASPGTVKLPIEQQSVQVPCKVVVVPPAKEIETKRIHAEVHTETHKRTSGQKDIESINGKAYTLNLSTTTPSTQMTSTSLPSSASLPTKANSASSQFSLTNMSGTSSRSTSTTSRKSSRSSKLRKARPATNLGLTRNKATSSAPPLEKSSSGDCCKSPPQEGGNGNTVTTGPVGNSSLPATHYTPTIPAKANRELLKETPREEWNTSGSPSAPPSILKGGRGSVNFSLDPARRVTFSSTLHFSSESSSSDRLPPLNSSPADVPISDLDSCVTSSSISSTYWSAEEDVYLNQQSVDIDCLQK